MCFELKKMKKLFIFNILVLLFITVSCSKQDGLSQIEVAQPKHPIIGKWKSAFSENGQNILIEFQENNILRVENVCSDCKGCSDCDDLFYFKIIDGYSVEFDYATNLAGEMMIMNVSIIDNDKLKTECKNKYNPNNILLIDAPLMCMGNWKFQRIQ